MKKYLKNLAIVSGLLIVLIFVLGVVRMQIVRSHSWKLDEKVHILFMGASHIMNGVDDSMMETAVNWASSSERYMFTYIKLHHLLPENPQIDTIFLELAATDLWEDTDYKYHELNEQSHFVRTYWPLFKRENWMIYKREPFQVLGLMISGLLSPNDLQRAGWWKSMGGYVARDGVIDIAKKRELPNVIDGSGHEVNYYYLRQIIKLCKDNGIKLYFIETPVYEIEKVYDVDYYHKTYKENFSEVEFLDYSNWELPLEERSDGSHLNRIGAKHFTGELKKRFNIK